MKSVLRKGSVLVLAVIIAIGVLGLWFAVGPETAYAATYTVTLTTDTLPLGAAGELRWAINLANANPGADTINFSIPGVGPHTLSPLAPLPQIADQVDINGYSEPGSSPANSGPAIIMIEIDGSLAGAFNGLDFGAGGSNSRVRGLAINRCGVHAIRINNATGVQVDGNYLGTDGSVAFPNTVEGVRIENGSSANIIGGNLPANRNIISGNGASGVGIDNNSTGNFVRGNYIGTDDSGTAAIANGSNGVLLWNNSDGNTVGGSNPGEGNIISGNIGHGVAIANNVDNSVVEGNLIGTDIAGTASVPNGTDGVNIANNCNTNTIGGTAAGASNLISGNSQGGVRINGSTGNILQGNLIGTDLTGTVQLPNLANGVYLENSSNNTTIGGAVLGAGNVISENAANGIRINNCSGCNIQGNLIGTDATGSAALPNSFNGVYLLNGSTNNTVGGTALGSGNVISGNSQCGVRINASAGNTVQGNLIGTDLNGTAALANTDGILITGAGAGGNIVGGNTAAHMNLISGNSDDGIDLESPAGNTVQGNYIGTDINGTAALANGEFGVEVDSSDNNLIGGSGAGEGNLISGNGDDGVYIEGTSTGNQVFGNMLGTDLNGTGSVPNVFDGLEINGCSGNTVGGATAGHRNIISGNGDDGIEFDSGATGNDILGNFIGTDINGSAALTNGEDGIQIKPGCDNNDIGGSAAGQGNIISGNTGYGILIDNASGTRVRGNLIGTNAAGNAALANGTQGVFIRNNSTGNAVGGDRAAGEGNLISGNGTIGVLIEDSTNNTISGNYIGTEINGTAAVGNPIGVGLISNANNNTIGGTTAGERNVISGNVIWGLLMNESSGNDILGNHIGTDSSGISPLPNTVYGIYLTNKSNNNNIGGSTAGHRNVISNNGIDGVLIEDDSDSNTVQGNDIKNNGMTGVMVDDSVSNRITRNSIYDNGNLGIELIFGGNNEYPSPVFSSATFEMANGTVEVEGTAPANSDVEIFYTGPNPDPGGSGEGLTYLTTVPSDGTGYFWASLSGLSDGDFISATAISQATGDTSEFGINAMVVSPPPPPGVTWYLAEGSTGSDANGGFETWILVQNAGDKVANVDVTYMTPQGEVAGPSIQLGPGIRWSVNVADILPDEWHVSTKVEADRPVVAERSMYWDVNGTRQAAHSSIGTMTPSSDWYFAEGSTGSDGGGGFETWVLVQNPSDEVANVDITYMTQSGEVAGPSIQLGPKARWTANTADTVPGEWHVAAQVSSDKPVVAERTMYWSSTAAYRQSAHSSIGSIYPSNTWYLAEGSTGSDAGGAFETYVLVQNPGNSVANVDVTYMTPQGAVTGHSIQLAPKARWTVNAGETVPGEWGVSTQVSSDQPVIAARSMYWTTPSVYRQAASSSIGAPFASSMWNMAEGSTSGGMETYILVQNPGQADVSIDMRFLTDSGEVQGPKDTILPARSRYIYCANDYVDSYNVSTVVNANGEVVVVRSMYGDNRAWSHSSIGFATPPN
jgi:hypothetical protein